VVMTRLGRRITRRQPTRSVPLPGGDLAYIDEAISAATRVTADAELANHLVHAYGSRWAAVADEMATRHGEERLAGLPYTIGEMRYAARYEMAQTLADLLLRRTHLAFETRDHGTESAERAARAVADLLGWDARRITRELAAYERDAARVFAVDP